MTAATMTVTKPSAMKAKRTIQPEYPFMGLGMPMNEYVRKDVFDARMDRMESLLAQTVAEIRLDNVNLRKDMEGEMSALRSEMSALRGKLEDEMTDLRGDFNEDVRDLRSDIRVINARLETLQTKFGWYMAMFGVVITVSVAAIQVLLK